MSKPLYPHVPKRKEPLFPHVPKAKVTPAKTVINPEDEGERWERMSQGSASPEPTERVEISNTTFSEVLSFVEKKLGPFQRRPRLLYFPKEEEEPPDNPGAYVVTIYPWEWAIYYARNIMPANVATQKRLLLHEVAEMRYDELKEEDIHALATRFTEEHYREIGAASENQTEEELKKCGYYWAFRGNIPAEAIVKNPTIDPLEKEEPLTEEEKLIRYTIGDIADTLHSLEQRLFYQVEAKLCEGGKVKPEFNPATVSRLIEAKQHITKADELLVKISTERL